MPSTSFLNMTNNLNQIKVSMINQHVGSHFVIMWQKKTIKQEIIWQRRTSCYPQIILLQVFLWYDPRKKNKKCLQIIKMWTLACIKDTKKCFKLYYLIVATNKQKNKKTSFRFKKKTIFDIFMTFIAISLIICII